MIAVVVDGTAQRLRRPRMRAILARRADALADLAALILPRETAAVVAGLARIRQVLVQLSGPQLRHVLVKVFARARLRMARLLLALIVAHGLPAPDDIIHVVAERRRHVKPHPAAAVVKRDGKLSHVIVQPAHTRIEHSNGASAWCTRM